MSVNAPNMAEFMTNQREWVRALVICTLISLIGTATHAAQGLADIHLRAVSSRPEAVSGAEVLVQLDVPTHLKWSAHLNGRNVTGLFHPVERSGKLLALLTGLTPGKHVLSIRVNGTESAKLEITDHPLSGPIFSGPHQEPFICQTVENDLGPALDSDCNAATVVQYYYKSTESIPTRSSLTEGTLAVGGHSGSLDAGYKAYNIAAPPPADVARTTTTDGQTVPYIVRREIGTLDRAVYEIQFLHQPGQPLPTPWTRPTAGWNGRLVYALGGGGGATYRQGILGPAGSAQEPLLAQGYAFATATPNLFNERVFAETLSMVKEHFIKAYGEPVHTIGQGGSIGAIQQYLIVQNYPGLLDGILPSGSFPDMLTNVMQSTTDCALLDNAFKASGLRWTEEQKAAVSGFATWRTCIGWIALDYQDIDPKVCDELVPRKSIYDRIANPKGIRCDIYDNEINIFGRDPRTGFARWPLDNVGVQYGLVAFNDSRIDAEHFIELNERVGGHDEDGNILAARTVADPETLRNAYQLGPILTGGGGLNSVPIIDFDQWYSDDLADVHDHVRSFVTRARLIAANGNADNQVLLVYPRPEILPFLVPTALGGEYFAKLAEREANLVREMDRWLDNIADDKDPRVPATKVSRNRPADLSDGCMATDGANIVEHLTYDGAGKCNTLYPPHGDPHLAAGAPLTDDVLKCELKPIRGSDYSQALSAEQLGRLRKIFPSGVCDYRRPGVGQQMIKTTW